MCADRRKAEAGDKSAAQQDASRKFYIDRLLVRQCGSDVKVRGASMFEESARGTVFLVI